MGHAFWTEDVEERVKLLELNALNCCLKITMADLSKIVLKWGNDVSEDLAPKFPGIDPHSTTPSTHQGRIFFALLAMNGPLPAELKFRENTEWQPSLKEYKTFNCVLAECVLVWW